jgi:hypothetical protein
MPIRKPQADEPEENFELPMSGDGTKQPRGKHRPNLRIPITEEGVIDMSRIKDPAVLEKARAALGMEGGSVAATVETPKVPREFIGPLYDGIAWVIGWTCQKAKWPKILTPEEMVIFRANMKYSDEFKEKAAEPTAALIDKHVGNSKLAKWLMEHSELAVLAKLFAEGTTEMMNNASLPIRAARIAAMANANGGFPPSENRKPEYPGYVETAQ